MRGARQAASGAIDHLVPIDQRGAVVGGILGAVGQIGDHQVVILDRHAGEIVGVGDEGGLERSIHIAGVARKLGGVHPAAEQVQHPPALMQHWRSYGTDPLPSPAEAIQQPLSAFPSWYLRITCDRCGKDRIVSETHAPWRGRTLFDILHRMRHDGCGGLAGKAELAGRRTPGRRHRLGRADPHRHAAGTLQGLHPDRDNPER